MRHGICLSPSGMKSIGRTLLNNVYTCLVCAAFQWKKQQNEITIKLYREINLKACTTKQITKHSNYLIAWIQNLLYWLNFFKAKLWFFITWYLASLHKLLDFLAVSKILCLSIHTVYKPDNPLFSIFFLQLFIELLVYDGLWFQDH